MRTLFGYMDGLYTNDLDLWRAERVTADEAEPFAVPNALPRSAYRIDGGALLYVDFDKAWEGYVNRGERLASWTLLPCGRRYELCAIIEKIVETRAR